MKNFKDFVCGIEETNELFNSSSKAEKRVMIAQDCIDRINLCQIKPSVDVFFGNLGQIQNRFDFDTPLKSVLNDKIKITSCDVCAKGGLFVSYIGRVNKLTLGETGGSYENKGREMQKLKEIFTLRQLSLIETAFEGQSFHWNTALPDSIIDRCVDFYRETGMGREDERLLAICQNIIDNKGTFKV